MGALQFVVAGEQDGDVQQLPLSPSQPQGEGRPKIEVSRLLYTRGYPDLPAGYVVHKVVMQVVREGVTLVATA